MKVKTVKTAGFCFGVQRAVDTVYELAGKADGKRIFTYGPIVHNGQVTEELEKMGVSVIKDRKELLSMKESGILSGSSVIIRAHGISDEEMALFTGIPDLTLHDATCPYVSKIHEIVRKHVAQNETVIVTGDPEHPEVKGITGCAKGHALVLPDCASAEAFAPLSEQPYCVVSQTTFNLQKFEDIVEILKNKLYDVSVVNTICNATQRRQSETLALARECDAMIVIGGKNSSNTAKLYDICHSECRATYYIQCLDDLKLLTIDDSVRCIGITAGASTPKTIIEEVLNYVRTEF